MKIYYVLVFTLFLSCSSSNEDINAGLIAHYPFDGITKDMSGKNNHLTVVGEVFTADRFGNENSAYSFDGLSSILYANTNSIPAMDSTKTISWWYYSPKMPQYELEMGAENMIVLVDSTEAIGIQFGFRARAYRTKGFDVWQWGGGTFMDNDHPEFNSWHHCLYKYDGTKHSFYIDGNEVSASTVKPKSGVPNLLMLGNYPGGDQFFKGKIDDVRIYNRELNQSEIKTLYHEKE